MIVADQDEGGCACLCRVSITGPDVVQSADKKTHTLKVKKHAKAQVIKLKASVEMVGCQPAGAETQILTRTFTWMFDGNLTVHVSGDGSTAELHIPGCVSPAGTVTVTAVVEYQCRRKGATGSTGWSAGLARPAR